MCNSGKRQSPINIDPTNLLFDPDLRPIQMDNHRVSGMLENNGHSIIFRIQDESGAYQSLSGSTDDLSPPVASAFLLRSQDSATHGQSSLSSDFALSHASASSSSSSSSSSGNPVVSVTGGPLSYTYHMDSIYLHFGRTDLHGSEHVVAGVSFPAEVCTTFLPPPPDSPPLPLFGTRPNWPLIHIS